MTLKEVAEENGLDYDYFVDHALKITEAFAASGAEKAGETSIPNLLKKLVEVQLELFLGAEKLKKARL